MSATRITTALIGLFLGAVSAAPTAAATVVFGVSADTHVRGDLAARINDNYGADNLMVVGTSRGGVSPYGSADAMRALVAFDLGTLQTRARTALLELTIFAVNSEIQPTVFSLSAHRILEPWVEGNGCEGIVCPPGSVGTDEAFGVAWSGIDANNQTQPMFDAAPASTTLIPSLNASKGQKVRMDVTSIFNDWIGGKPNYGILLRDGTSDGGFREIFFGARVPSTDEQNIHPARLLVTPVPLPASITYLFAAAGLLFAPRFKVWSKRA